MSGCHCMMIDPSRGPRRPIPPRSLAQIAVVSREGAEQESPKGYSRRPSQACQRNAMSGPARDSRRPTQKIGPWVPYPRHRNMGLKTHVAVTFGDHPPSHCHLRKPDSNAAVRIADPIIVASFAARLHLHALENWDWENPGALLEACNGTCG